MSLKDLARQTLEDFNPAKDNASEQENDGLPAGEYDVVLKGAQFQVYDSGYEAIAVRVEVLTGEHAQREEFININLDPGFVTSGGVRLYEEYPFMLKQNIKYISQLAFATGVQLEDEDWEDMVTLADAFQEQEATGAQFILEVKKSTNKAKTKEYTNYVFAKYADDPVGEFNEDDLPY